MEFQEKCPNCGHSRDGDAAFCVNCGKPFEESKPDGSSRPEEQAPPPPPRADSISGADEADERKYVAWEDKENIGFFQGIWTTWKESVFSPDTFYARLPFKGGIGSPLLYALIVAWIGIAIEQVWGVLFSGMMYDVLSDFAPQEYMWATGLQTGFSFIYLIFFAPIIIIAGMFIISGIFHLVMLIFGWTKRDFEATFRAIAYAHGPIFFYAIPACGGLIGFIWTIVLAVIGIKHMQKTTGGKAALTVFLPVFLCCCLLVVISLIFGAALIGLIQQATQGGYYYD